MIKRLRMKLIAASMISLLAVLLVIESIVGVLNYRKIVGETDRILEVLQENNGKFPPKFQEGKKDGRPFLSPELPYESRYFSVLLDLEGEAVFADTGRIAAVDTADAIAYAQAIWEKQSVRGFIDHYRYFVSVSETEARIIFLDCRRQLDNFQNLLLTAVGVTVLGLSAVLILLIYLSARIVKPFSDNYEKQKRFITDAGHELKTPLTIIDADTEILEMDYGENEWLKDIQGQTKRLADLTNALVLLSRMEESQKKEMEVEFLLSDLVEEVFQTFQAPARIQEKKLTGRIVPLLSMKGDEKAIRGLITILLDNALKYSDEKGEITVTLERQKNRVRLTVWNTAEHISKEQITHLFDRFYRTDASRNSQTGGYGLGLSIAAATAAAHRAKITAETEDEKSLRITVLFPQ